MKVLKNEKGVDVVSIVPSAFPFDFSVRLRLGLKAISGQVVRGLRKGTGRHYEKN